MAEYKKNPQEYAHECFTEVFDDFVNAGKVDSSARVEMWSKYLDYIDETDMAVALEKTFYFPDYFLLHIGRKISERWRNQLDA